MKKTKNGNKNKEKYEMVQNEYVTHPEITRGYP